MSLRRLRGGGRGALRVEETSEARKSYRGCAHEPLPSFGAAQITQLRSLFGKKEFTLKPLDLNEATREVIALSLTDLQRNRVILRSELADDLPPVTGNRVQLQEVILNLVRNASDAMVGVDDRPRQLLIRTEREDGDRVRVTVRGTRVPALTARARISSLDS